MLYRSLEEEIKILELGLPPKEDDSFIGGRLDPKDASLILLPLPWDATVSFKDGTAKAPDSIRIESHQLDIENYHYIKPYTAGICMLETNQDIVKLNKKARKKALKVIKALENGETNKEALDFVNKLSHKVNTFVYENALNYINQGKFVALVGGDHSSPLGLIKALNDTQKEEFGILHIDAHHDLREAYEGFTYSHASIFYNTMKECDKVSHLSQIGIRDYSKEEAQRLIAYGKRASCLYDTKMQKDLASGKSLENIFQEYIDNLPKNIYLSIDIDGLEPSNCPNTGTPVPGGLSYSQLEHLLFMLVRNRKSIIGFDLCEVGYSKNGWDENVGSRVLYQLCGALLASCGKIAYK